jgi:hypothetical protein
MNDTVKMSNLTLFTIFTPLIKQHFLQKLTKYILHVHLLNWLYLNAIEIVEILSQYLQNI